MMEPTNPTVNLLSSVLGEDKVNIVQVVDQLYEYTGTISHINSSLIYKATKIRFIALPNRDFLWPSDKGFPLNIQVGSYVQIKYKEVIIKSYSYFWIERVQIIENTETTYSRHSKPKEQSPSVKCSNCGSSCALANFIKCDGVIIEKRFWLTNAIQHCNRCNSVSEDKYIGNKCIRETMLCNDCNCPRNI